MTLRYIPNSTKLSPIQMFLKAARDDDRRFYLKREKKLRSFEYLYALRRAMGALFPDNILINDFFEQFAIQNKNIKKQLEKEQLAILNNYFENNNFNKIKFEQDFITLTNRLSEKFNESDPTMLAIKIIDKNELRNGELVQPDICQDIGEFKQRYLDRNDELKYLTMYLATASVSDIKNLNQQKPNSELLEIIQGKEEFIKLRQSYHQGMVSASKNDEAIKNRSRLSKIKLA